jgi:GT2 family glycosyltransferase
VVLKTKGKDWNIMDKSRKFTVAVLLACHNRKQKTLRFLDTLVPQSFFANALVDIYLLDDLSADGTAAAVKDRYPCVNIVMGNGNLYWAGGMRTVWKHALSQNNYELFCLFNDDVVLFDDALQNLVRHYKNLCKKGTILIGSTVDPATYKISYGGNVFKMRAAKRNFQSLINPHPTELISCKWGNANVMLVDSATVCKIGIFSPAYTHFFADFDYTRTAVKAGIDVFIAPGYYGYCEDDHPIKWLPANRSLKDRINYLFHPKGLAYKERLVFVKKFFPLAYLKELINMWMKTLFPVLRDKFEKKGKNL